jgi:hypothetical protein
MLAEQVRRVQTLRNDLAGRQEELGEAQRQFLVAHAAQVLVIKERAAEVEAAEMALRALAIDHFTRTGETKPTAGVEVKQRNVYAITDAVAALAWAKSSGVGLVPESIDEKAILKVATVSTLPFVSHTTTPQAQIATDLDKVLVTVGSRPRGPEGPAGPRGTQ